MAVRRATAAGERHSAALTFSGGRASCGAAAPTARAAGARWTSTRSRYSDAAADAAAARAACACSRRAARTGRDADALTAARHRARVGPRRVGRGDLAVSRRAGRERRRARAPRGRRRRALALAARRRARPRVGRGALRAAAGLGVAATDKVWPTLLEQLPGAPTAVAAGGYSSALLLDPQARSARRCPRRSPPRRSPILRAAPTGSVSRSSRIACSRRPCWPPRRLSAPTG